MSILIRQYASKLQNSLHVHRFRSMYIGRNSYKRCALSRNLSTLHSFISFIPLLFLNMFPKFHSLIPLFASILLLVMATTSLARLEKRNSVVINSEPVRPPGTKSRMVDRHVIPPSPKMFTQSALPQTDEAGEGYEAPPPYCGDEESCSSSMAMSPWIQ